MDQFLTYAILVFLAISVDTGSVEPRHHRSIRSPQLFSGRNVLTDLTQMKPPSLNDLQEFRQRMANLANLTAVLEHAIAAEKAARTALHGFVSTIRDQVMGVQRAVNPDPENYWAESKTCGGVLVSQTGRITYKLHDFYQNHERCTWTIRANYRSKIRVTLTSAQFEDEHDFVGVTELMWNGENACETEFKTKRLSEGQTELFDGPLILITFFSDGSVRKKGFRLEFEGLGTNSRLSTMFQHFHFSETNGMIDAANLTGQNVDKKDGRTSYDTRITTIVVNPKNWNSSSLRVTFPEDGLANFNKETCNKSSLAVSTSYPMFVHDSTLGCYAPSCDTESDTGIALLLMKQEKSQDNNFKVMWVPDSNNVLTQFDDTCGGILTSRVGKLRYKVNSRYGDNENCLWIIHPKQMGEGQVKVQLVKDGFEEKYDYVTLSYLRQENNSFLTTTLYKTGSPVVMPSPYVIVQFYTDSATFGKPSGFELMWEFQQTSREEIGLELTYSNQNSGSQVLSCSPSSESNQSKLHFIQATKTSADSALSLSTPRELTDNIKVFVGEHGTLQPETSSNVVQSRDGILAILWHCPVGQDITLDWNTVDVSDENSVSSESTHAKSEDECGEVLYGDSGQIVYKIGKEYSLDERCTWIIRPKRFSAITVQLMADGFESCCDGLQINKIDLDSGVLDVQGITISRENRFRTLEASALLVTFLSDHTVTGTGFVLEFQSKGPPLPTSQTNVDLKHWHVALNPQPTAEDPFGPIFIQTGENVVAVDTFVFQHLNSSDNVTVETQWENLELNGCNQDSVSLYEMPTFGQYKLLDRKPSLQLCQVTSLTGSDPITLLEPSMKMKLHPKGLLLSIAKIKSEKVDKTISFTFQ